MCMMHEKTYVFLLFLLLLFFDEMCDYIKLCVKRGLVFDYAVTARFIFVVFYKRRYMIFIGQSWIGIWQLSIGCRVVEWRNIMIVAWADVPGYDGKYQASVEGDVRRVYQSGKTRLMTPYRKKMSGSQRLVVKLTHNGKSKEEILMQVIAKTFLGEPPDGFVPYHKNGCQTDNYLGNIAYISKKELGQRTGKLSRSMAVLKIDPNGEVVDVYRSAREAGRKNFMSYQTVIDRCNGKCKGAFAPDGYAYAWENKEKSVGAAVRKIEASRDSMPKARSAGFEW